jgi:phosphate transport system substrate-binding protein
MKHFAGRTYLLVLMISILLFGCKKSVEEKETILKGTATILVDETLEPVVEDEITIFRTNIKPRSYWSRGLKSDASISQRYIAYCYFV